MTGIAAAAIPVRRVPATVACASLGELGDLYLAAFAGPPWHATPADAVSRREVMAAQMGRAGAEVVLARDGQVIIGAAWGWGDGAALPDDRLHRSFRAAAGAELTRQRIEPPAVTVVELMVAPTHWSQGLGHRLLEALVSGRPAWLLTHPEGGAASFYRGAGWETAGPVRTGNGVPLLVMTHPGRADREGCRDPQR